MNLSRCILPACFDGYQSTEYLEARKREVEGTNCVDDGMGDGGKGGADLIEPWKKGKICGKVERTPPEVVPAKILQLTQFFFPLLSPHRSHTAPLLGPCNSGR